MPPRRFSSNWIVGAKPDLVWFVGSSFAAYGFLFLSLEAPDAGLIWLLWAMLLDTPHYFGTYSRTFMDAELMGRHRGRILGSLLFPVLGPAIVAVAAVLHAGGVSHFRLPIVLFTFAFNLWAYWHLARQHYGLMTLYKRRNGDHEGLDRHFDNLFLYGGLLGSLLLLGFQHPESRASFGLPPQVQSSPFATALTQWSIDQGLIALAWTIIALVSAGFFVRQFVRMGVGRPVNLPKVLFLAAVVSSYVFVSAYTPGYVLPLLFWTGAITIAHNFQYHAIVWFYHRNRRDAGTTTGEGWSLKIRQSLPLYLSAAVLTGVFLRVLGTSFEVFPGLPALIPSKSIVLFANVTLQEMLFLFMLGFAMNHYYLDQIIWRPSKDAALRTHLRLSEAH